MSCCPPAGIYNIIADQGATFSRSITWKDSKRVPIVLTGYQARMQVRETVNAEGVVLELTSHNGRITLNASPGRVDLKVDDSIMANTPSGKYVYDLELVAPSGDVYKLVQGNFVVRPEVTR